MKRFTVAKQRKLWVVYDRKWNMVGELFTTRKLARGWVKLLNAYDYSGWNKSQNKA